VRVAAGVLRARESTCVQQAPYRHVDHVAPKPPTWGRAASRNAAVGARPVVGARAGEGPAALCRERFGSGISDPVIPHPCGSRRYRWQARGAYIHGSGIPDPNRFGRWALALAAGRVGPSRLAWRLKAGMTGRRVRIAVTRPHGPGSTGAPRGADGGHRPGLRCSSRGGARGMAHTLVDHAGSVA
jgi:hypothetical protein